MSGQLDLGSAVDALIETSMRQEWSQADLARRLRVSAKHMNQVWKGKTDPSLDLLEDWARLLGFEVVVRLELRPVVVNPSE